MYKSKRKKENTYFLIEDLMQVDVLESKEGEVLPFNVSDKLLEWNQKNLVDRVGLRVISNRSVTFTFAYNHCEAITTAQQTLARLRSFSDKDGRNIRSVIAYYKRFIQALIEVYTFDMTKTTATMSNNL